MRAIEPVCKVEHDSHNDSIKIKNAFSTELSMCSV